MGWGGEPPDGREGGKQSSDETVYLDGCATHGGASERAPVPDVNLAVSLIDAAPETLLRERRNFRKSWARWGNERDLSHSTLRSIPHFISLEIRIIIIIIINRVVNR